MYLGAFFCETRNTNKYLSLQFPKEINTRGSKTLDAFYSFSHKFKEFRLIKCNFRIITWRISESELALLARYVYTYEEFVILTEAATVQQNDSNRTGHRHQNNNIQIGNVQNGKNTICNSSGFFRVVCKIEGSAIINEQTLSQNKLYFAAGFMLRSRLH